MKLYFSLTGAIMVKYHSPIRILRHGGKEAFQPQPRHALMNPSLGSWPTHHFLRTGSCCLW
jgi:hypothetical protein